ncbi:hypothetical protein LZZ85_07960 [Terrimonas sp. NA20]|uniref:Uncharacterized protein n=1 Tax=Terrimonas ginsenosidimutans TaxID=2908004 RepID=A0ABS9KPF4_9BACT|nr:hypothetical protein [Terrimonas ginsenosidimutans]MCG2614212.1 hypothetical protein [Terrimonas ginsenosidimutans]
MPRTLSVLGGSFMLRDTDTPVETHKIRGNNFIPLTTRRIQFNDIFQQFILHVTALRNEQSNFIVNCAKTNLSDHDVPNNRYDGVNDHLLFFH